MEVKPGYKQTEVGVIPKDWDSKPLGEAAEVVMGQSPAGTSYNRAGDGAPLINGPTEFTDRYPIKIQWTTTPTKFCRKGDVLLCVRGSSTGRINVSDDEYCIGRGVAAIRARKEADTQFITFQIDSAVRKILSLTAGSTFPNIDGKSIRAIPIPLPLLNEQRAIARALGDVDALLVGQENLISKKRDLKQAAMQQLLTGQKRLPGFTGEWDMVKFSDISDKRIPWSIGGGPFGSNLKTSDYTTEGVRIIQLQNIGDGRFHNDYAIYTSEAKADELLSNNIYPGEIILSKMGDPVARACFIPNVDPRYLMASDGIRLAVDARRFNKRFVHDYINSAYFRKKAIEASTGSTRQRIGLVELKHLPFVAPSLAEQTAISTVLSDMDAELSALEQRRDKTRALKQGMMQELLTGKTRLI